MSSVDPAPKRKGPSSRLRAMREPRKPGSEDFLEATEPLRRFVNVEADGDIETVVGMIESRQIPPKILKPIYDCIDQGNPVHINGTLYQAIVRNRDKYSG